MFLEAVVSDHSLDSKGFTYFVPEHLRGLVRRGCVVEVPFGDELVPAVVTESDAPPPDRTEAKSVVSILVADPIVHPYQIEAAYALAKRYFIYLHTALSFFLPTPVFRRFLKTGKGYTEPNSDIPSSAGPRVEWIGGTAATLTQLGARSANSFDPAEAIGRKSEFVPLRPTLAYDHEWQGAAKLFWTTFPMVEGSVLVLPSDAAVEAFLTEREDADSFLVHLDSLTEAKDFRLRLAVAARERPFLVWSRKLCSYNLAAYPNVFYFEDALFPEARHKFFHAYDHAFLFESFAKSYPFRLTVSSFVPSPRLMALAAKGEWNLENA